MRTYDLIRRIVVENCKPTQIQPSLTPSAQPLSVTAPDLTVPSGVLTAVVEKVIDPTTLQLRYEFSTHTIRLRDVQAPPRGTAAYRQALALMQSLAPAYSVLYLETSGNDQGYVWQLSNQINLLMIEQGLMRYVPQGQSDYADLFEAAERWAKDKQLGLWAAQP